MGDSLVKTGLGKNSQDAKYYDTPQQAMGVANQNLANDNYGVPGMSFAEAPAAVTAGAEGEAPQISGGTLKPNFLSNNAQLPTVQKPSFAEASATGKGLTKKGLLFDLLMGAGQGAAAGWGAWDPGQGYARGANAAAQPRLAFLAQKKQAEEDKRLADQEARQQQQLDQNAAENKSQADLRAQQIKESEARTSNRELTDEQKVASKKAIALSNGIKEGTPEYNQYVFGVTKAEAPEKKLSVEDQLVYGDPSSDQYKRAQQVFARQHRVPAGENDRAYNDRLKKDTSKFYADIVAKQGGTDKALDFIYGRLKSGQLTDYQKQVAAEAVSKLRSEQAQFMR